MTTNTQASTSPTDSVKVFDLRAPVPGEATGSDNFEDAAVSGAKWSQYNHGGNLTVTYQTTRGQVRVAGTGNGADRGVGLYQAIPSATFTFVALIGMDISVLGNFNSAGIGFFENAADGTKKVISMRMDYPSLATRQLLTQTWNNYQAGGAANRVLETVDTQAAYLLRGRQSAASLWFDVGFPSVANNWLPFDTLTLAALGYTPAHFGILVDSALNGSQCTAVCPRVWVFDGVAATWNDLPPIGLLRALSGP